MVLQNFIVFEGIDGAGTTTQLDVLRSRQDSRFLFTQEPTSSPTGKYLRQMLKGDIPLRQETAAYIFAADRNEHVNGPLVTEGTALVTGIVQACSQGKTVVSDRYLFSSLAYQSINCDPSLPRMLNGIFPLPQLLFYFEIDPKTSLSRIQGRGVTEIYEKEEFLARTVEEYHKILDEYRKPAEEQGMKIVVIDATLPKDEISEIIWKEIQGLNR